MGHIQPPGVAPSMDPSQADPTADDRSFPLSAQQRGLWFIQQLDPESAAYNMLQALQLTGDLDVAALGRALSEIVRRHEALRTTFTVRDGEPRQEVQPPHALPLPQVDLGGLPEPVRDEAARRLRQQECLRPFDLQAGPLLRVRLLRLAERRHELQLVVHHIVNDGWSESVLVRELTVLYEAFRRGQPSPLPELEIQYADYSLWQDEWLQGGALETQLHYWRRQLAGLPALEFSRDVARSGRRGRGAMVLVALSRELCRKLKDLARSEGVTLFIVLLAGFKLLLSRYASQKDVAVGTIIANRRPETEGLIGFFVNNIVLRTDLRGPLSFRGLLRRVQATTLAAYEHPDVPFDKLVEEVNPERIVGATPLIQAEMVFQDAPGKELRLPGIELQRLPTEYTYSLVDLALSIGEEAEALVGNLMYSTDVFAPATVEGLLRHFERLLEQAADAPERDVDDLPMLTEEEHRRWVVEWNAARRDETPWRGAQELFEEHARLAPEAPAVGRAETAWLTYGDLNRHANRVAHHLRERGVGPETRVAICVERDATMVVALLSVLKAGGAYVPLDPAHPAERRAFMLRSAGASVLLTTSALAERFAGQGLALVCLDDEPALAHGPTHDPQRRNGPENLAYIIYTSGSTGEPKGVMVTHGGLANMVRTSIEALGTTPRSRFAQLAPFTFDASLAEILTALCAGGSLYIVADQRRLLDGPGAHGELRDAGVTIMECAPSLVAVLSPEGLPALEILVVGGEACPAPIAARWLGRRRVFNAYGPTEATVCASLSECDAANVADGLPIGRPLANTCLYVLDDGLNPVPPGVAGEIYVGGMGVARGYVGRPDLTAERFVPDPFSAEPARRLYRTGDRARFEAAGYVAFLGRLDGQVKLRGQRIELGEIETRLRAAPGVRQCAVVVWEQGPGDQRLVAYVVLEPGEPLDRRALRDHLAGRLPEYMLPAAYVGIEALPVERTGKLALRRLPAPSFGHEAAFTPPRSVLEQVLAEIWADVLGLEQVGVHDDFFALGGHSLLATKVTARARAAGIAVTLGLLFEARSVARLAAQLREAQAGEARLVPPPLRRRAVEGEAPLSFSQQRLWLLDQLEPGLPTYNMPLTLRLRGDVRVDALRETLEAIVRRHAGLRTSFPAREGQPYQSISADARTPLELVDLSDLAPEEREPRARALVVEDVRRPFDLARGPLLRTRLYVLGDDRYVLCLTMHHIVGDALSLRIFLREFVAHYEALRDGRPAALPELPLQYADVAAWERDWLRDEVLARHLDYWRRRLEGAPTLALPTDFARPAVQSFRCDRRSVSLPAEVARGLARLCRRTASTEFMGYLALIDVWLHHWSGQRDVLVGAPISNRHHVDTEPLIGFFIDTIVLRTQLDERASFAELLASVRARAIEDYAYQSLPFEKLVDELGTPRDPSRHALFQVMFNMVTAPEPELDLTGVEIEDWDAGLAQSGFDLHLGVRPWEEATTQLVCTYSSDLFRAATIEARLETFGELARLAAAEPETALGELVARLSVFDDARLRERRSRQAEGRRDALRALPRRSRNAVGGPEVA